MVKNYLQNFVLFYDGMFFAVNIKRNVMIFISPFFMVFLLFFK